MALIDYFVALIRRDEEGQGLAEYALILALIAIVAILALTFLGGQISAILSEIAGEL
jgi:pilus assembly protein Flp/PilA